MSNEEIEVQTSKDILGPEGHRIHITPEGVTIYGPETYQDYYFIPRGTMQDISSTLEDLVRYLAPFDRYRFEQMITQMQRTWQDPDKCRVTQTLMTDKGNYVIWLHFPKSDKTYRIENIAQWNVVRDREWNT